MAEAVAAEKAEARESCVRRQAEKYERLAEYALDDENRQRYEARAEEWREEAEAHEAGRIARAAQRQEARDNLLRMLRNSVTVGTPYVDAAELQSELFSRKFSRLTPNSKVNDAIRSLARGNLTKNSGTYTEMLDILDLDTGASIIHKRGATDALEVLLDAEERAKVRSWPGKIIGMHNHPTNILPTGSDFVAAASRGYDFGLVVTHDLRVFRYTGPTTTIDALSIDRIIDKYTRMAYDDGEKRKGFEKAMQELQRRFGITWQEM